MWNTNNPIHTKDVVLYFTPQLKWYQKILQKLHIKNYYKKISTTIEECNWKQMR